MTASCLNVELCCPFVLCHFSAKHSLTIHCFKPKAIARNLSSCFFLYGSQMQFMLLFSRQGKLRLQKWYVAHPDKLKKKITRELITTILARKPKMCSFLEWKDVKIVYKRYLTYAFNNIFIYFCFNFVITMSFSLQVCQPIFLLCH